MDVEESERGKSLIQFFMSLALNSVENWGERGNKERKFKPKYLSIIAISFLISHVDDKKGFLFSTTKQKVLS